MFRQTQPKFTKCLQELRVGLVTEETKKLLIQCQRPLRPKPGQYVVSLFHRRNEAAEKNTEELKRLVGDPMVYEAMDRIEVDEEMPYQQMIETRQSLEKDKFFAKGVVPFSLHLKVGAQVILAKNINNFLFHGLLGVVTNWLSTRYAIAHLEERRGSAKNSKIDAQLEFLRRYQQIPVVKFVNGLEIAMLPGNLFFCIFHIVFFQ